MRLAAITIGVAVAACGTADFEPIGGDITFTVGTDVITPTAGAAIRDTDPANILIVIGTRDVSCQTSLGSTLQTGTYLSMLIAREASVQTDVPVSLIRVDSSGTQINGTPTEVTIDTFADRITGSVMFATQDDASGTITSLAANGTFDVIDCD